MCLRLKKAETKSDSEKLGETERRKCKASSILLKASPI